MSRFLTQKSIPVLAALALVTSFISSIVVPGGVAMASGGHPTTKSLFCSHLGKTYQASSGAQMYCFGPQPNGAARHKGSPTKTKPNFGSNVDAANPAEDVSAAGVQALGQSEVSIAASGSYVVEAWNDASG